LESIIPKSCGVWATIYTGVAVLVLLEGRMQQIGADRERRTRDRVAVLVLLEVRMQHVTSLRRTTSARKSCSPCFAGSSYATMNDDGVAWSFVMLQSLFCWKFVCNRRKFWAYSTRVTLSCSPCFAGSSYATAEWKTDSARIV